MGILKAKRNIVHFGLCFILMTVYFTVTPTFSATAWAIPHSEQRNFNNDEAVLKPGNGIFGLPRVISQVDPSDHPALKPIDKPIPAQIRTEVNSDGRANNLNKDTLYLMSAGESSSGHVFALVPDGKGGLSQAATASSTPGSSRDSYGASMGLRGDGKPIVFYIKRKSRNAVPGQVSYTFYPWSAVDGDNYHRQYNPYSYTISSAGSCWGNPMAVAPNGTIWAYRDVATGQANPTRYLTQFVPWRIVRDGRHRF